MSQELRILPAGNFSYSPTARDLAVIFFRNRQCFVIIFLGVLVAGVLYAALAPSYVAEMKILVRRGRIDPAVTPTQTAPPLLQQNGVTEEELNSEVELLRSDDILRKVIADTGLADRPSWAPSFRKINEEERIARAMVRLEERLNVQAVRKSHLITVSYESRDRRLAADVLRSLADAYLAKQAGIRRPIGQQAFFDLQTKQSRGGLRIAQQNLLHFTHKSNVASATLERDLTVQKLSEAEASDLGLQASIAEAAERVRSLQAKLQELPERRVIQIRNSDNPQLQERLKSKLLELQLKRTELLTRFQPSYRLVEEIDHQIAQAKSAIEAEDLKPLRDETTEQDPDHGWATSERIKSQVELQALQKRETVANAQVAGYRRSLQKLSESVVTQDELEQDLKAAEDKYLLYANKREEARIGDALDEHGILNVTLAQAPRVPVLPVWPLWMATCLSFAAACVFATGGALAADYFDNSFRTPGEVIKLLGTPVLVSLPAHAEGRDQSWEER